MNVSGLILLKYIRLLVISISYFFPDFEIFLVFLVNKKTNILSRVFTISFIILPLEGVYLYKNYPFTAILWGREGCSVNSFKVTRGLEIDINRLICEESVSGEPLQ